MIAYIKGTIQTIKDNYLILENAGLGYKVYVSPKALSQHKVGEDVTLHTYNYIKEEAFDLYGFTNIGDLELFEKLISVSGIGPKTGLNVFAAATASDITAAIVNNDPSILKEVSGIGAKTAERIVLELKNKVAYIAPTGETSLNAPTPDSDVLAALTSLGYNPQQARDAIRKIPDDIADISQKVKAALQILATS